MGRAQTLEELVLVEGRKVERGMNCTITVCQELCSCSLTDVPSKPCEGK